MNLLQEKINNIFRSVINKKGWRDNAIELIQKLDATDEELFAVLWTEAILRQNENRNVFLSAYTLYKLNIKCSIDLKSAIEQMCKEWEVSIEEVPWYLANQFSKEKVIQVVNELNLPDQRLKTILYWLEKI